MIGTITASTPDKTVVTFRDGEMWTFHPPDRIRFLYPVGETVQVEEAEDRSFIVYSVDKEEKQP